uniref:Uncharacterized protein n=1 Tax=Chenopodium quinoa TaxID=63459 RepID=A0A803LT90_CHEQI
MTAIGGNYVNFGVFELYGDKALDDALDIAFKMILSIPAVDLLAYRKCASAIDNLATFYFDHIMMGESPASPALLSFAKHISDCADIFLDILKTMFEIVLYEDNSSQWGLSRAILSLILISEEMYTKFKTEIVASQPVDQQQRLFHCFDILMEGVTLDLESANRDRFTRNLGKFRKEFREK